jgi:endonuclease-3
MPPNSKEINIIFHLLEQSHKPTMLEQLAHYTPFQLLIATLLSARTKDATVISIVKELFKEYPHPQDFIDIDQKELEKKIYRIGFYRAKAKNIKILSQILLTQYQSKVPNTLEELTSLPGVGRKTANCILSYVYHKPAIAVDIHVHRIANRTGWVKTIKPEQTEKELQKLIPKTSWNNINRLFVSHGQTICSPINPKCHLCPIITYCAYGKKKTTKN